MRKIGNVEVSSLGMGCMGLSHASGTPTSKGEAVKIIRKAYEIGYTMFDTAECYTGINPDGSISYNEELVGEALEPIRDQVFIATKFGVTHKGDHLEFDSSPEKIRQSLEMSLKRLKTDHVDLYYQHRIDPKISPETVAGVMKELISEGKIKAWGISEVNEDYLRRAHAVCPVAAIQNRYSMMARWHENLFPVCEELGIAYVAFSPMANGFLTGSYDAHTHFEKTDFRSTMPQYTEEGVKRAEQLTELLSEIAKKKKATPAQISLAWILCKKPFIIPIPGSRKINRLEENFDAQNIVLTPAEMNQIDTLLDSLHLLVFGGH